MVLESVDGYMGNRETFIGNPEPKIPAEYGLDIFENIFDEAFIQEIVKNTNLYAEQERVKEGLVFFARRSRDWG